MMRRIFSYILLLVFLFGIAAMPAYGEESQQNPAVINGCSGMDGEKPYLGQNQLIENLKSAFVFELNSQSVMYAWNADLPQYPASLVKIMTALLVLENASLTDTVTVSQSALDAVSSDAISVNLLAGEQMTVENLLYCMMVKSANDAAAVLAEYISGSQESFVAKMNVRAAELGCTGTTYTNAHGLHDDKQLSTARDTCRVLQEALKHEFFRTIFGTVDYTVPATNLSEERLISTNNYLMSTEDVAIYLDDRVTGGRTGVTTEGFRCIASTAKSGKMDVVCIVMGAASTILDNGQTDIFGGFPETTTLLDHAFEGNAMRQIVFSNQVLRQLPVVNGDNDVFAIAQEDVLAVLPAEYGLKDLSFQFSDLSNSLEAPISKGDSLGTVQIMYGSSCIAQTEIYAANQVSVVFSKAGSYLEANHSQFHWIILVVLAVLVVLTLFAIKYFRSRKGNTSDRRRRI